MTDDTLDPPAAAETEAQFLAMLAADAGQNGFQRRLDDTHTASFVERGAQTLLVTFEKTSETLARGETGLPIGLDFADEKNWSLLHLSASRDSWFRGEAVYAFFDELVDVAFFEEFDRVVFYGAGMGGYAAAAYAVTAPGAILVAVAPQATLDHQRALWDNRFPEARRMDFRSRYGFAPDMVAGCAAAYVLFDPYDTEDAMHASLFFEDNVHWLRCRHLQQSIEPVMAAMDILHEVIERAADGRLSDAAFGRLMRGRRENPVYLRNLLFYLDRHNRPLRMAVFCTAVQDRISGPAFRRKLNAARDALKAEGRLPDWLG